MKKKSTKIVSLLICLSMLLTCVGCSGSGVSCRSIDATIEPVRVQSAELSEHYCATDGLKEIDTSGLITLLFDENSGSVGVRVTNSEDSKLWSSLPQLSEYGSFSDEASVISLNIVHNGKRYILNSQDNCVSQGGMYFNKTDEGFEVVYLITDNGDWLNNIDLGATDEAYSSAADGNILYKVTATYYLKDGCFYADLSWVNLGNSDDVLINIGFLEYFGADDTARQGDYILVPDGSGALIDTASKEEIAPVDIAVYGNDIGGSSQLSSVVAAYGMRSGNDAFAAVIGSGESVARITANKALNGSAYNRVGPVFTTALSQTDENSFTYTDECYSDKISICFRFLSGANATYSGMAAACREQLIRDYTLSTRSVEEAEYMPLLVNIVGKATTDGVFSVGKELTDYNEAVDILGRIKSKGVDNVYLRYTGALKGGLLSSNAADASALGSLGGMAGVEELNKYASSLNFKVFYDISLVSDTNSSSALKNLNNDKFTITFDDPFTQAGFGVKPNARHFIKSSLLEDSVLTVLERFHSFDATGYCLTDIGKFAFTELDSALSREDVIAEYVAQTAPLSTKSPVMVCGGNFYSLKNADVVSMLPMSCSRTETESYISVPFVQIILHGIVEFSYDGINMASDSKKALLRCVEFGAIPGYVITDDSLDGSEKYAQIFSADNLIASMYDSYFAVGEVLADLRASRITDHYKVSEGVYCTEYESTTRVYVNYTNEPVTVSGITVNPMSFIRVN